MDEFKQLVKDFLALWDAPVKNWLEIAKLANRLVGFGLDLFGDTPRPAVGASKVAGADEAMLIGELRNVATDSEDAPMIYGAEVAAIPPWMVPLLLKLAQKALEKWLNR